MGHDDLGTRHILLGLLAERNGVAAGVLRSFGFELEELTERVRTVRSAREEPNPGSSGPARITQPAVITLSYAAQEAWILGKDLADTEHVLLGLTRVAHTHQDCGFARLVGFDDRLRIRNEILRLVARPPDPAEVARRKASATAAPGEFEAYAVGLLCDTLRRIPAEKASAIQHMTMRFSFEQSGPPHPVIDVEWNSAVDADAHGLDAYAVRIPSSGSGAQRGLELRRLWAEEVSRHPQQVGGVDSSRWEGEIGPALVALGRSLSRLLGESCVLWDVVGHSISTSISPPPPHRDGQTGTTR